MKIPVGFPFFDHPGIQKVTTKERGDYFLPTKGVDIEVAEKEYTKSNRVIKKISYILVAIAFAALIVWAIIDPGSLPRIVP